MSAAFSIAVPASVAFDYPTQDALASYISNELSARALVDMPAAAVCTPHQQQASTATAVVSLACQYPEAEASGKSEVISICSLVSLSCSDIHAAWGHRYLKMMQLLVKQIQCHSDGVWEREFQCLFSAGPEGFQNSITACRDLPQITPFSRWDAELYYAAPGTETGTYARFGAYCSGLGGFDAAYFSLPTSEALALDPHTRHLLHMSQVPFPIPFLSG